MYYVGWLAGVRNGRRNQSTSPKRAQMNRKMRLLLPSFTICLSIGVLVILIWEENINTEEKLHYLAEILSFFSSKMQESDRLLSSDCCLFGLFMSENQLSPVNNLTAYHFYNGNFVIYLTDC